MNHSVLPEIIRLREWLDDPENHSWQDLSQKIVDSTPQNRVIIDCSDVTPKDISREQGYYLFYLPQQNNWTYSQYVNVFPLNTLNEEMANFLIEIIQGKSIIEDINNFPPTQNEENYPNSDTQPTIEIPNNHTNEKGTEEPTNLNPGTLLRDRYRVLKYIGGGSFGETYLAIDTQMPGQFYCVVKRLKPSISEQGTISKAKQLFDREAIILNQLRHDCIPTLLAYFDENNEFYLIQEYIEGDSLDKIIPGNQPWGEEEIKKLLSDILTPLAYLHQNNVIHRDIKPANLIRRNSDQKIVLIDFGAVKAVTQANNGEQTATIIGTSGYMPIEQIRGGVKPASDLYAVGIVAIQAATGCKVSELEPDNWEKKAPQLKPKLKTYLKKLTAPNYRDRFPSATEALEALEKIPKIRKRSYKWLKILLFATLGLIGTGGLGLGVKSFDYLTKPKISADPLVLGTLWKAEAYTELEDYLEKEFVPANYLSYLKGEKLTVIIDGDRTLTYEEAKKRIARKDWDIAFATSPVISIFAKDNGYSYLGGMFPDSSDYESGLFVRSDSPIQSVDDIKNGTKIALGSVNSASSFITPSYLLYGKTVTVDIGNRGPTIISKVKSGEAEVGAAAIGDAVRKDDPELRIIYISSKIPGAGVYMSPKLSESDRQSLQKVMLKASPEIQKKANYGNVPEPDYTEFKKVIARVDEILICSDFTQNPVNFFCPPDTKISKIKGKVNGVSTQGNKCIIKLVTDDNNVYRVSINRDLFQRMIGTSNLTEVQGKNLEITTTNQPLINKQGFSIEITQPKQFNLLD